MCLQKTRRFSIRGLYFVPLNMQMYRKAQFINGIQTQSASTLKARRHQYTFPDSKDSIHYDLMKWGDTIEHPRSFSDYIRCERMLGESTLI